MKYKLSEKYDKKYVQKKMMGPNAMKLLEELLYIQPISQDSLVLDLGCGKGLTSVFMVKEYGLRVIAADLWITPTENKEHFDKMGLTSSQIIPILAEAHQLPFAEEYFDAAVSVDSYQYFGTDKEYLGKHLLPYVKKGGYVLIVVPGLKQEFNGNIPPEMFISWTEEDISTFHDVEFWTEMIKNTGGIEIISVNEMQSFDKCWDDWLQCDNEYAAADRASMEAGAGKFMNFISIILRKL